MSNSLKIAIIHYHLRGGGVTRVIENTVSALNRRDADTVVLIGEEPPAGCPIQSYCRIIEGMSYGYNDEAQSDAETIAADLKEQAQQALGSTPDVWHIHNHALGKNIELTRAILKLAEEGHSVLFQLHDFAEDGRSSNYKRYRTYPLENDGEDLTHYLYPQADHLHYGVLNGRDYRFLSDAGVEPSHLHLIQNPVYIEGDTADSSNPPPDDSLFDPDKKLFLYPTRAIRRKNVGEFVLWAILSEADQEFAVTLSPKNPEQRSNYVKWTSLSNKYQLPLHFEVGRRWSGNFPQLMRRADYIVTTSVAEGFGFCFLEPWLFERPLFGRDLPLITNDFRETDIQLPGLYRSLTLPIEWFTRERLFNTLRKGLEQTYAAYGKTLPDQVLNEALSLLTKNDRIDFGVLDESAQEQILELLIHRPDLHRHLQPSALIPANDSPSTSQIKENRQQIASEFNLEKYTDRLLNLYRKVAASSTTSVEYGISEPLLDRFLDPEMFTLLRT